MSTGSTTASSVVAARRPATIPARAARVWCRYRLEQLERQLEPDRACRQPAARRRPRPQAPGTLRERLTTEPREWPLASRNECWPPRPAGRPSGEDAPRLGVHVRPPRAKPQSVMPRSAASRTAKARRRTTATMIGQPATAAFWTSSNESRPLTQRIEVASGSLPARNAQPTTLSSALCRPTSSRRQTSFPSASKSPGRMQPARGQRRPPRAVGPAAR